MEKYSLKQKNDLKRISVNEISSNLPDLKTGESKAIIIGKWLISTIENSGFQPDSLLPSKKEMAYLLGVSSGTVQNALRYAEDLGYLESKQCIGTMIKDRSVCDNTVRKLTSKREYAINLIKKYILKNNYKEGKSLPSARSLASLIECSSNTTRLAIENLVHSGILERRNKGLILKSLQFAVEDLDDNGTLVKKVENDLKKFIVENLSVGDRIPPHGELSNNLSVSIKTIHDALKNLVIQGILLPRRGRYGTVVLKMPFENNNSSKKEDTIFASAPDTAFYYYEKTQEHIKKMIAKNYDIGSKLPSIAELSKQLDLSPNTIRKAFHNLAGEGYLVFSRGRYGGTFVVDVPEEQSFKWLSVNPKYAEVYQN